MESIINFFQWLADLVGTIINLVTDTFESLFNFIRLIPIIITFVTSSIGYLPTAVMSFATISIAVAVILLLLGRNNN